MGSVTGLLSFSLNLSSVYINASNRSDDDLPFFVKKFSYKRWFKKQFAVPLTVQNPEFLCH